MESTSKYEKPLKKNCVLQMNLVTKALGIDGIITVIFVYLDLKTLYMLLTAPEWRKLGQSCLRNNSLWAILLEQHFHGPKPEYVPVASIPIPIEENLRMDQLTTKLNWEEPFPMYTDVCNNFIEFLVCVYEYAVFDRNVIILRGSIEFATEIKNTPVDAIIFPTNPSLHNPHIGAAGAVFRRAGKELDVFIYDREGDRVPVGEVYVTPGFDADVKKLIHCVGPSVLDEDCATVLEQTYENALQAAMQENLKCIAMASISTGNLGVPIEVGSHVALRTIQKFLRCHPSWNGIIGLICYENIVFNQFVKEKKQILQEFNHEIDLDKVANLMRTQNHFGQFFFNMGQNLQAP